MDNATNKPETLMTLLMDAPDESVFAVQDAIRAVARGDYRAASVSLSYAADWYEPGHVWGDRAERCAAALRAKASTQ